MNKKIQAISLVFLAFFLTMPLASADWSSCKQYSDRYEVYDEYGYKYLRYQNYYETQAEIYRQKLEEGGLSSYRQELYPTYVTLYEERAKRYAYYVEYYGAKSRLYHQKFYECTEDMGTPEELTVTKYNKYGEWICYSVDGGSSNHCMKTRLTTVGFTLNSGRYIKMQPSIEYQLWTDGYFPYEASSKYRSSRWFIGQDLATTCIYANDFVSGMEKEFCGKQTVENLAPYVATIVSAGAIATVTTTTYMTLAGT